MLTKIKKNFIDFPERNSFFIANKAYADKQLEEKICTIKSAIEKNKNNEFRNIGIMAYDDIETYASILAVLFSGLTFVPINPSNQD